MERDVADALVAPPVPELAVLPVFLGILVDDVEVGEDLHTVADADDQQSDVETVVALRGVPELAGKDEGHDSAGEKEEEAENCPAGEGLIE